MTTCALRLGGTFISARRARIAEMASFTASMAAACAVLFQIGSTPQIALATSVLFLVPGVQMINSIMDLMHGHILMGISRGIHSIMMIACIAIGLSATMLIVGVNSL